MSSSTKLHFLDRTDPTFVQDLKDSVVHVTTVVGQINAHMRTIGSSVHLNILETKIRPNVKNRKAYSDSGDVQVVWEKDQIQQHAILEFKQRKSYNFESLAKFKYDDIYVDSLPKFEKIRKRNDTLGYILTNQSCSCIFATDINQLEEHMVVMEGHFRSRPYKWVALPKQYFKEGMDNVCLMICRSVENYMKHDPDILHQRKLQRQLKICRKKLEGLREQLQTFQTMETQLCGLIEGDTLTQVKQQCTSVDEPSPKKSCSEATLTQVKRKCISMDEPSTKKVGTPTPPTRVKRKCTLANKPFAKKSCTNACS